MLMLSLFEKQCPRDRAWEVLSGIKLSVTYSCDKTPFIFYLLALISLPDFFPSISWTQQPNWLLAFESLFLVCSGETWTKDIRYRECWVGVWLYVSTAAWNLKLSRILLCFLFIPILFSDIQSAYPRKRITSTFVPYGWSWLINTQLTGEPFPGHCCQLPPSHHCRWPLQLKLSQAVAEVVASPFFQLLPFPSFTKKQTKDNYGSFIESGVWDLGWVFMWNPPIHSSLPLSFPAEEEKYIQNNG